MIDPGRRLARAARDRPWATIAVILVVSAAFAALAAQQQTTTEAEAFLPDDELARALDVIQADFGNATPTRVQVVVRGDDVLDPDALDQVLQLQGELRANRTIRDAMVDDGIVSYATILDRASPHGVAATNRSGIDDLRDRIRDRSPGTADALDRLLADADPDGTVPAGLVVVRIDPALGQDPAPGPPRPEGEASESRRAQLAVDAVVARTGMPDTTATTVSDARVQQEIAGTFGAIQVLIPVAMIVTLVVLGVFYRSGTDLLLNVAGIGLVVVWTFGAAVLLGPGYLGIVGPFTSIQMAVPVMLVGLSVDYGLQLIARYREALDGGEAVTEAIGSGVRGTVTPILLAATTTAVAFLSNVTATVPPMRDFGIVAAVGIVSAFVVMMTVLPAGRRLIDVRRRRAGRSIPMRPLDETLPGVSRALSGIVHAVTRHPVAIVVVAGIVAGGSFAAATRIDTTFEQTDFLPADSQLVDDLELLQERFRSAGEQVTILVTGDHADPALWEALGTVEDDLADVDGVTGPPSRSAVGLARDWATEEDHPDDRYNASVAEAWERRDAASGVRDLVDRLERVDDRNLSAVLRTSDLGASVVVVPVARDVPSATAVDRLEAVGQPVEDAGAAFVPTSQTIVFDRVSRSLQQDQAVNLVVTLGVAVAILVAIFTLRDRRPGLGFLAVVPVTLATAWILGSMVLLGISYNVLTAFITALTVGIGVDYAIHIAHRFLEDLREGRGIEHAADRSLHTVGSAVLGSAVTTAAGFSVLMLAPLEPMQQIGLLTALSITYSLLASTIVLPAILVLWSRWHGHGVRS